MGSPRDREFSRLRAQHRRTRLRARRLVLGGVTVGLLVVALALVAFGGGEAPLPSAGDPSSVLQPTPEEAEIGVGRPTPKVLASIGNLPIQLPVADGEVTAIGFHGADDGSVDLQPAGRQGNEGVLARLWRRIAGGPTTPVWYQLPGPPGTDVLDVGARVGADVYSPADGAVIAISDRVLDGVVVGARIDLRPTLAPSVTLSVLNVEPDPSLVVGTPVYATTSRLGTVVDVARVERQSLAAVSNDEGNGVAISAYPAAGSLP